MHKETISISLFEFNKRVLYQGMVDSNKEYSLEELNRLLMFNDIFVSNINEMFIKGGMSLDLIKRLEKLLKVYDSNVEMIRHRIAKIDTSINLLLEVDEYNLDPKVEKFIFDNLKCIEYDRVEKLSDKGIYFIAVDYDNKYYIMDINNIKSIHYQETNLVKYDYIVKLYLKKYFRYAMAFKITYDRFNKDITKIEWNGDIILSPRIAKFANPYTRWVYNDNIYIRDLKDMMCKYRFSGTSERIDVSNVKNKDLLIEYPKHDFESFLDILRDAANDPNTQSINITIYRVGGSEEISDILVTAANNGVKVSVNIELFAFGERVNQMWKKRMQDNNIRVIFYGYNSVKNHSKLFLIKYKDGTCLSNVSTGNYNRITASQYTDLSVVTSDPIIGRCVEEAFKLFETDNMEYTHDDFLVTQYNAKDEILKSILQEAHEDGLIIIKCNAIDDKDIINHLLYAADKGCKVKLIVRGVCAWVPDHENIEIRSYVWDKLEHSRILLFGKDIPVIYMGSLDLLKRKIDKRIEIMIKIKDNDIKNKMMNYIDDYLNGDNAWILQKDGSYRRV